jgi:hypothetical protein
MEKCGAHMHDVCTTRDVCTFLATLRMSKCAAVAAHCWGSIRQDMTPTSEIVRLLPRCLRAMDKPHCGMLMDLDMFGMLSKGLHLTL